MESRPGPDPVAGVAGRLDRPSVAGVPATDGHDDGDMLDHLAEDGRGLLLVDALAARWGTRAALAGRLVWADL